MHAHNIFCQITRRGGGINDRDGLTDMTLLHYASKSGAGKIENVYKNRYTLGTCDDPLFFFYNCLVGVGDVDTAAALVTELISQVLNGDK